MSSQLRDNRGYTVLHSLLAYNRTTIGDILVPLVTAILRAAEEVDFAAEFPLGRIKYDDVCHMKQFFSDIGEIKSDIAAMASATEQLICTESQQLRGGEEPIRTLVNTTNDRANNCQRRLKLLQTENAHITREQSESKEEKKFNYSDDLRVREENVIMLLSNFLDEMKLYEEATEEFAVDVTELNGDAATSTIRKRGGSLRLLLDQNNRAKWSPLHLICVQGGFTHGKVPLFRVILQEHQGSNRQKLLSLLDRQNRNVLHHLLESEVPSDDTFQAVHYVIGQDYSLLLQKDDRGKTPLDYVFARHEMHVHSGRTGMSDGYTIQERNERNYLLLKVLIGYLERGEEAVANDEDVSNDAIIPQNLLHAVCRLPMGVCPEQMFKVLFKGVTGLEKDVDEDGNTALHLLLANPSYKGETETSQQQSYLSHNRTNEHSQRVFRYVLASNRDAIYVQNKSGHLPLRIAMDTGRREVLSDLIMVNHQAVQLDKRLEGSPKLMAHMLGVVASLSHSLGPDIEPKIVDTVVHPLDTMFELIRGKPDIISFGGSGIDARDADMKEEKCQGKKTWRKKLNPFRLFSRSR